MRRCSSVSASSSHYGQTSSYSCPILILCGRRRSECPVRSLATSTLSARLCLSPGVTRRGPFWAWCLVVSILVVHSLRASCRSRGLTVLGSIGAWLCSDSAAALATSSAVSLPGSPAWPGTHCRWISAPLALTVFRRIQTFARASVCPAGPASGLLMADWESVHISTLLDLYHLFAAWRKLVGLDSLIGSRDSRGGGSEPPGGRAMAQAQAVPG